MNQVAEYGNVDRDIRDLNSPGLTREPDLTPALRMSNVHQVAPGWAGLVLGLVWFGVCTVFENSTACFTSFALFGTFLPFLWGGGFFELKYFD